MMILNHACQGFVALVKHSFSFPLASYSVVLLLAWMQKLFGCLKQWSCGFELFLYAPDTAEFTDRPCGLGDNRLNTHSIVGGHPYHYNAAYTRVLFSSSPQVRNYLHYVHSVTIQQLLSWPSFWGCFNDLDFAFMNEELYGFSAAFLMLVLALNLEERTCKATALSSHLFKYLLLGSGLMCWQKTKPFCQKRF